MLSKTKRIVLEKLRLIGLRIREFMKNPGESYVALRDKVAELIPKIEASMVVKAIISVWAAAIVVAFSTDLATAISGFAIASAVMFFLPDDMHELPKIFIGSLAAVSAAFLMQWFIEAALICTTAVVYDFLSSVQRHWKEQEEFRVVAE